MKVKVPIHRTSPTQSVLIDPAATVGAQIGVNLLLPDGTLAKMSDFGVAPASGDGTLTTTDDLDEGQWNLWFTDLRAQDAVGGILVDTATIDFTYTAGASITADLKDLADSGVGAALVKITRDAKGRISGTSAATTTDLTEGTNLYFTASRVLSVLLAGLSTASSAVITVADSVLSAFGKLQAQITANLVTLTSHTGNTSNPHSVTKAQVGLGNVDNTSDANKPVSTAQATAIALKLDSSIPAGYIDGAKMVWNSGTSLSVTSGAMYIQSLSKVVAFPSTLTLSGLSLTASTWYHLYGYLSSGTPTIELVTTTPAAPYNGTARSKTGDTSRRYVGSVLTDASGNLVPIMHSGDKILYKSVGGFSRILSNGSDATSTIISCAAFVPLTAMSALFKLQNNGPTNTAGFITPGDVVASSATGVVSVGGVTGGALISFGDCPLDASQQIAYITTTTGSTPAIYITVINYTFGR